MRTPSVEPRVRSRLLPRISFRVVFAMVTAAAVFFWLLRQSWSGNHLIAAIVLALMSVIGFFTLSMTLFLIAWLPALVGRDKWAEVHRGNPFSENQLPPQILKPRNSPQ